MSVVYKQFPSREMNSVLEVCIEPISQLGNCLSSTEYPSLYTPGTFLAVLR